MSLLQERKIRSSSLASIFDRGQLVPVSPDCYSNDYPDYMTLLNGVANLIVVPQSGKDVQMTAVPFETEAKKTWVLSTHWNFDLLSL